MNRSTYNKNKHGSRSNSSNYRQKPQNKRSSYNKDFKRSSRNKYESDDDDDDEEDMRDMSTVSFKTLNKAQEQIYESKNDSNEASDDEPPSEDEMPTRSRGDQNSRKPDQTKRAHKHAPAESNRVHTRVSVVREIPGLAPSSASSSTPGSTLYQDIRFDTTYGKADLFQARKNYSFLDDYRKDEIEKMKQILKDNALLERKLHGKRDGENGEDDEDFEPPEDDDLSLPLLDSRQKAELKLNIQKLQSQLDTMTRRDFEHEAVTDYKRKVKTGELKGPLHLKRSQVKKLVLKSQYDKLKKSQVKKMLEKRRMRNAQKERKMMPLERRG